eukprot:CAMPEP_0184867214 /NCGR_PEP_ID=MMETSP0580-20130426/25493_1 /TAXON_ID=1118495 /ORGANISM="Dactyliosolen fragilissimus" /LENGTH=645 /DNA_ID=CAMNT_0027367347 /DNA_START=247 /DNA_END=2181 /DNA_ORIENTATION=-
MTFSSCSIRGSCGRLSYCVIALEKNRVAGIVHGSRCYSTTKFSTQLWSSRDDVDNAMEGKLHKTSLHTPLVFVPGMKGTHLAFTNNDELSAGLMPRSKKSKRSWITLSGLLNFPPRPDHYPGRDLSLPLTYTNGVQDRGKLSPDGVVDHIIEFGPPALIGKLAVKNGENSGSDANKNKTIKSLIDPTAKNLVEFFPFYGHVKQHLNHLNNTYLQNQDFNNSTNISNEHVQTLNELSHISRQQEQLGRPTAIFAYDWRRSLPELSNELHDFCEKTFPGRPVQVVAHSLGGLLTYAAMRRHPSKYKPGAVLVGVPFGTGIQYFQDLHKGYYTELDRCRQFTPVSQFTFSSHWSFFPTDSNSQGNIFVDVTGREEELLTPSGRTFKADQSTIGKNTDTEFKEQILADNIEIDFYDVKEWERHEIGIFDPNVRYGMIKNEEVMRKYKEHMYKQMVIAKEWRETWLGDTRVKKTRNFEKHNNENIEANAYKKENNASIPPLVICATNTLPTVNQILRRKKVSVKNDSEKVERDINSMIRSCSWEYDYISGGSVPGDGRIDFEKAFPYFAENSTYRKVELDSPHAKQMCWEEKGGSWGKIWNEVTQQVLQYEIDAMKFKDAQSVNQHLHTEVLSRRSLSLRPFVIMKVRKW